MFQVVLLGFSTVNFCELAAIQLQTDSPAHNNTCENPVLQGDITHGCQSVASGTHAFAYVLHDFFK